MPAPPIRLPRLGDRKDLRIEIQPSAVSSYRQTRKQTTGVNLTDAEAREELEDVLLQSSVKYSSGEDMTVRGRVRRLEVDVESELVRVAPDHLRCSLSQVRRIDVRTRATGSRMGDADYWVGQVRDASGKRLGFVRVPRGGGVAEYRPVAEGNGAEPGPWVSPLPEHARAALRQVERNRFVLERLQEYEVER